jgi:glycerophosphoryl diester phosphodiesterase
LLERLAGDWLALLQAVQAASLNLDHRPLDRVKVSLARSAGLPLVVYTVNEPLRARQLLEWGVTAIVSDRPDLLVRQKTWE